MLWGVWDVNFRHLRFSALGIDRVSPFLYIFKKLSKKQQSCLFNRTRHKICYKLFILILNERFNRGICL